MSARAGSIADAEVGEARHANVLAGLGGQLLAQLLDRLRVVLFGVDVGLVEQRHFPRPLGELALDDLLHDVVRFAVLARLLFEDPLLRLALLGRDLLGGDVLGRGGGDVQGDLVGENLEVLVAGDEVGLALDFDHRPDPVVGMDVGGDGALAGAATRALGGGGLTLHPKDLDRAVNIPLGLDQSGLAVHHRRPGPLPQRLDIGSGDAHFEPCSLAASAGDFSGAFSGIAGLLAFASGASATGGAEGRPSRGGAGGLPPTGGPAGCGLGALATSAALAACAATCLSSAALFAASSASRRAFSSSSRFLRSSSSFLRRSISTAMRRSSWTRQTPAPSSTAAPIVPITSRQERIASSLPGI